MPEFNNISISSGHLSSFSIGNITSLTWNVSRSTHDTITVNIDYDRARQHANDLIFTNCSIPVQTISCRVDWDSIGRFIERNPGYGVSVIEESPVKSVDEQIKLW